jgi:two-component system sensor histidine kinase KdpD
MAATTPPPWLAGLSLLCHDLRRPLTVIRGAATLLVEAQDQLPPSSRAQILGLIDQNVETMAELIEDLSVAARLEAGALDVATGPLAVDDLLEAALESARRLAPGAKVAAAAAPGLEVEADRELTIRALRALLLGALERSSEPLLRLEVEAEDGRVRLLVRIPPGSMPQDGVEPGFEPLVPAGRDPGLALYMARGAARAMGGDLVVSAEPDTGFLFSFTLSRRV